MAKIYEPGALERSRSEDRQKYLSREKPAYTKKEKLRNWFYYYKWWLALGAVVAGIVFQIAGSAIRGRSDRPDYRVACVTGLGLSDGVVAELEEALAGLGEDINGDGKVRVKVTQYITGTPLEPDSEMYYGYAADVQIQADILGNESYFFLVENPEDFQKRYQILADGDGELPGEYDYSAGGRARPWQECPALDALELDGEAREAVSGLYVGRRGFRDASGVEHREEYEAMWLKFTGGGAQ